MHSMAGLRRRWQRERWSGMSPTRGSGSPASLSTSCVRFPLASSRSGPGWSARGAESRWPRRSWRPMTRRGCTRGAGGSGGRPGGGRKSSMGPSRGRWPAGGGGRGPRFFPGGRGGYRGWIEGRFLPQDHLDGAAGGRQEPDRNTPLIPGTSEAQDAHVRYALRRAAWARPRIPLLPDEEPSPMSRALLVADSGSGVGAALPATEFIFINVDVAVVLPRDPVEEWLLLEAATAVGSDGTGLAMTRLSDRTGPCGPAWQTRLLAPPRAAAPPPRAGGTAP